MQEKAIAEITVQMHTSKDNSLVQEIGKSLISLCENEEYAELLAQDLEVKEMSLEACYKAFYDYASKNKKSSCFAGSAELAEQIIRDFYGLHETSHATKKKQSFSLAELLQNR